MLTIRSFAILILMAGMFTPGTVLAQPAETLTAKIVSSASQTLPPFVKISAGNSHTCALTDAGVVKCWGSNEFGQLGNSSNIDRSTPVDVEGLSGGFTALAAGYSHTCAVTAAGGVKCWGNNGFGQLGDGTQEDSILPVDVIGLDSVVTALAAAGEDLNGNPRTCALTSTGGLKCWGSGYGPSPVDIEGLSTGVTALTAGENHTCALTGSGGVKCWGENLWGQLGDGTTIDHPTPVDVIGLASGVTALAAGGFRTCAVTEIGAVMCWGLFYPSTPAYVYGLADGITALAAGGSHFCALTSAGGVKCWGDNRNGQLGDGTTSTNYFPRDVVGLASGITALAAGGVHSCALTDIGGIKCWGANDYGQLGDGTIFRQTIPMDVSGLGSEYTILAAGGSHTCAMAGLNEVKCWGYNDWGQLGDGTLTSRRTPVDVVWNASKTVVPLDSTKGEPSAIKALAAGGNHTCALTVSGGVKCWGMNVWGQLGIGSDGYGSSTPLDVLGLTDEVAAVVASGDHTCALTTSGGVKCWGDNRWGELGTATTAEFSPTPLDVTGLTSGVIALAAGGMFTCALTEAGGVKCWGYNQWGQLGDGTTADSLIPVDVSGLASGISAIAAGQYHTCAALIAGGVKCWGDNRNGQLGDGTTNGSSTPLDVEDLPVGVVALAAGGYHTCALTGSAGMKCWGANDFGQLGDGTLTQRTTPVDVVGLTGAVTSLAAGTHHSCALVNSGRVKCWGDDHAGQLGLGSTIRSLVPVDIVEGESLLNYSSGKPGSYFTITGKNFQPGSALIVTVNGQLLSTPLQVNETGGFIFFLNTGQADPGQYSVTVSASSSASASFSLEENSLLRLQEGGGTTLNVPDNIAVNLYKLYVPVIAR